MDVAIAGGHGKIALRLLGLLAERGDRARGLIRNLDHAADLEAVGATAVGADLENLDADAIGRAIAGADAVVFAAGAGPGSGPARKRTVDYGGAVKLIDACRLAKISRYLMISAMGVHDPAARGAQMQPYYEAKLEADEALAASGLDHTIVRPGQAHRRPGHRPGRGRARASIAAARSPATTSLRPCSPVSTTPARSAPSST